MSETLEQRANRLLLPQVAERAVITPTYVWDQKASDAFANRPPVVTTPQSVVPTTAPVQNYQVPIPISPSYSSYTDRPHSTTDDALNEIAGAIFGAGAVLLALYILSRLLGIHC
jgi:hypothetical protein